MPSLKEIKTRIASVNSTRKITSAMKMVASSKLHHAQQLIENMLPYESMLEHILKAFLASMPEARTPLNVERKQLKRVALVPFSSNSSLCGGFNANVTKLLQQAVAHYREQGVTDIVVYPIGRKITEQATKMGLQIGGNFNLLAEKPNAHQCADIATDLSEQYAAGELDRVELIYHHFKSAGSQILTRRTFLPIDLSTELGRFSDRDLSSNVVTAKAQEYLKKKAAKEEKTKDEAKPLNDNFLVEPDMETILTTLIPKELNLMVYTALLDSNASEHAARMVAMQTATDNADELLRGLNLQYNKSRQQAITNELLDIMGGSVNN
ncbi:ATP F0F1 synthase subunit gamma [Prevotella sp. HMSC073D09]|jgi:ATP synthase F1, gamma subunit|uniref:F0F1 ATP synthase subunit gamma n=1 Tax=Prevotella sp. HMSC073D09 TaxID=1739459 RepID=UPI0008A1640E|nr:F0F1 ATP synthase subunit gamma [Prevotella sp. HMSC073D09]OFQ21149.1 ATP F0F1 synthase subunit gamma [Prevotella sp. HMSC073D09]